NYILETLLIKKNKIKSKIKILNLHDKINNNNNNKISVVNTFYFATLVAKIFDFTFLILFC
ncbi:MAG TPA: hypothetical protein VFC05_13715, partial [Nitrososphaeraceae archaeon]|nr:hypothetical protein [Nitrososphaeraceae archaeon]